MVKKKSKDNIEKFDTSDPKGMEIVERAIEKFIKKNGAYDTCVVASFVVFDKEGDVDKEKILAYGKKEVVIVSTETMLEMLKKEKKDFGDPNEIV